VLVLQEGPAVSRAPRRTSGSEEGAVPGGRVSLGLGALTIFPLPDEYKRTVVLDHSSRIQPMPDLELTAVQY
jgi:hypothetical protein